MAEKDLRYPIGKFTVKEPITEDQRYQGIVDIQATPANLRAAVAGLSPEQLATPYRPEGWTLIQVVHHLPDSHLNAYTRFKLALTEDNPVVKVYDEARWAELEDGRHAPLEISLTLLEMLHVRWILCLQSLAHEDFSRTFQHPVLGQVTLDKSICLYAWHGRHHVAHITSLRDRMGW